MTGPATSELGPRATRLSFVYYLFEYAYSVPDPTGAYRPTDMTDVGNYPLTTYRYMHGPSLTPLQHDTASVLRSPSARPHHTCL